MKDGFTVVEDKYHPIAIAVIAMLKTTQTIADLADGHFKSLLNFI